jgi:hypothetical protein
MADHLRDADATKDGHTREISLPSRHLTAPLPLEYNRRVVVRPAPSPEFRPESPLEVFSKRR